MDKIKELLEFEEVQATDEQIAQAATRCKVNLSSDVTDAQALAVIAELKKPSSSSLATSNGSQAAKSEPTPRKPRKSAKQVALEKAITHAAKQTDLEVESLETVIRTQKTTYVDNRATSLVNEIRNTSAEIVESVTDKLLKEEGDTESFRQIGELFSAALFPLGANS